MHTWTLARSSWRRTVYGGQWTLGPTTTIGSRPRAWTSTVDDNLHVMAGRAFITHTSGGAAFMDAIVDLTQVFAESIARATRGVAIVNGDHVVVRDEVETLDRPVTIRWNMVTPATVRITGSNSAELVKNGKRLVLRVSEPATVTMKTWSAVPEHAYDSPNPGTSMVGFEVTLPANASTPLTVLLLPESAAGRVITPNAALSRWP